MSIQANINQSLSLAGFLFSQSNFAKTQGEARTLKKQIAVEKEAQTIREKERGYTDPELAKSIHAKASRLYSIQPTVENLEEEEVAYAGMEEAIDVEKADKERVAKSIAEKEAAAAAEKKQQEEAAAAERFRQEAIATEEKRQGEASETIRQEILSPYSVADEQLQKAIETKRQTNFRKGGITR